MTNPFVTKQEKRSGSVSYISPYFKTDKEGCGFNLNMGKGERQFLGNTFKGNIISIKEGFFKNSTGSQELDGEKGNEQAEIHCAIGEDTGILQFNLDSAGVGILNVLASYDSLKSIEVSLYDTGKKNSYGSNIVSQSVRVNGEDKHGAWKYSWEEQEEIKKDGGRLGLGRKLLKEVMSISIDDSGMLDAILDEDEIFDKEVEKKEEPKKEEKKDESEDLPFKQEL